MSKPTIHNKFLKALAPATYGTLMPKTSLENKTLTFLYLRNIPEGIDLTSDADEITEDVMQQLKKVTVIFDIENELVSFKLKSYLSFKGLPKGEELRILDSFSITNVENSDYFPHQSYTEYDVLWQDFINDKKIVDKSRNSFYLQHPNLGDDLAGTATKDGAEPYKRITIG